MIVQTKTDMIADRLRKKILSGAFPDGRIPGERELAEQMQVSRVTVRRSLAFLEQEQLISRQRHNGTIIQNGPADTKAKKGTIGLLCQMEGHFYSEFYHLLLAELLRNGFAVQDVDTTGLSCPREKRPSLKRVAGHLLDTDLAGLVIDGYVHGAIPFIEDFNKKHPLFINYFDSNRFRKSTGVWFNFEKAGYLAGKYLMERGCKHPLLIPNPLPFDMRFTPEAYSQHKERQLNKGFSKALSEAGLEPELFIIDPFFGLDKSDCLRPAEFLWKFFASPDLMPDGVFTSSDSTAARFLKDAEEYGLKLPADFPLIGCYNTPWSHGGASRPFSSIDLNAELAVKTIVEQLNLPYGQRKDVYIDPKLIVRESEITRTTNIQRGGQKGKGSVPHTC